MPKTYSALYAHIVFATADRERWLRRDVRQRLHPYLGGIARNLGGIAISISGVEDHVHILARYPPRVALSDFVGKVKANSSKWLHETWPTIAAFGWQDGFAAFSVSASRIDGVIRYIECQESHHRRTSFDDEMRELLRLTQGEGATSSTENSEQEISSASAMGASSQRAMKQTET